MIDSTGTLPPPAPARCRCDLVVTAASPAPVAPGPDADQFADLVIEQLTRSASPPAPQDLDNDLLRGRAVPGRLPGQRPPSLPQLNVGIGAELTLTTRHPVRRVIEDQGGLACLST